MIAGNPGNQEIEKPHGQKVNVVKTNIKTMKNYNKKDWNNYSEPHEIMTRESRAVNWGAIAVLIALVLWISTVVMIKDNQIIGLQDCKRLQSEIRSQTKFGRIVKAGNEQTKYYLGHCLSDYGVNILK